MAIREEGDCPVVRLFGLTLDLAEDEAKKGSNTNMSIKDCIRLPIQCTNSFYTWYTKFDDTANGMGSLFRFRDDLPDDTC